MAKTTEKKAYILKVALTGDEGIWRRIAIRGNHTLGKLHEAIFKAFDRYDCHLYSFYFPQPGSRGRARRRDALEYTHPFVLEDDPFAGEDAHNAEKTKIDSLGLIKGQSFDYLFDFGDSWEHVITVEATEAPAEKGRYPHILEKHGESPPQYPEPEEDEE
ncbi:MAG: plasmid pRiA4b ORF-3 family protein [bacterium]|nr:plasmid pRiA4b ORF-3 family protein [bacterium]